MKKKIITGSKPGQPTVSDGYAGSSGTGQPATSTPDEIIELQDVRLSPIPSIRNRHSSGRSVKIMKCKYCEISSP